MERSGTSVPKGALRKISLFFCKLVQAKLDQLADLRLIVRIRSLMVTVRNYAADCTGIMSQMGGDSGYCRSLHLKIGHLKTVKAEALEFFNHVRHG